MRSCAWSASSIEVSAARGSAAAPRAPASRALWSWRRSGPLTMTARSADDPVAISVDVSMIGCVKLNEAPGCRTAGDGAVHQIRSSGHAASRRTSNPAETVGWARTDRCRTRSARLGHDHRHFRDCRMRRRMVATSADLSTEIRRRLARIQMTPSSSCGRNPNRDRPEPDRVRDDHDGDRDRDPA